MTRLIDKHVKETYITLAVITFIIYLSKCLSIGYVLLISILLPLAIIFMTFYGFIFIIFISIFLPNKFTALYMTEKNENILGIILISIISIIFWNISKDNCSTSINKQSNITSSYPQNNKYNYQQPNNFSYTKENPSTNTEHNNILPHIKERASHTQPVCQSTPSYNIIIDSCQKAVNANLIPYNYVYGNIKYHIESAMCTGNYGYPLSPIDVSNCYALNPPPKNLKEKQKFTERPNIWK